MISITSAQLDAWIALFVFPLTRILGLLASAPVFNNSALPVRVRLIAGLAIALAVAPALPPLPAIPASSWIGLAVMAQQMLIGVLLGFTLRISFAAVDLAGELIGLQMGLSFATFFDPDSGGQTPVVSEFLGLLTALVFLALNGHLLTLTVLAESFTLLPVSTTPIHVAAFASLMAWSAILFSTGLLLALPLITALLIANIALGVLARIAQQLNLFSVGFTVTLALGFLVLLLSLPYIGAAMEGLFTRGFEAMGMVMKAAGNPL
ncbi:MAG: flagellar biosynthetic protein FliR [Sulfuritalea sp.]|nr:flagellar biosynthetic protein FliR [Sulfuritalea sp.]MBK8121931.1 flagellar biosynthetic protein FliR [Sulfuritalea sp.]